MPRRAGRPAADRPSPAEAPEGAPLRMRELSERSGVPRETIHFYLREGLLPRPRKGGRTVAYYGEDHLSRLRTIRRLREEKYLPLAVIRRLLDAPAAAAERDVDALAEVLDILPRDDSGGPRGGPAPSAEALREAGARGLLGARAGEAPGSDPAERRVLALVDEALALGDAARALTLADLEACAGGLDALVAGEAALFFDAVFQSGDLDGSIAALRGGRSAVARFIAAYRDLLLRRVVEEVLTAVQQGPAAVARAALLPLPAERRAILGEPSRREALLRAATAGDAASAGALVLHLFALGDAAALCALPGPIVELAGPRSAPLAAWAALEVHRGAPGLAALERAVLASPERGLGSILLAEATLARAVRPRASLLEEAVPALHRLVTADPDSDPEPVARALAHLHRGRAELALPAVLGRRARGVEALRNAKAIAEGGAIDPAVRERIAMNARRLLGPEGAG
jgi:DNA-binding transcriptional MerR regulator